MVNIAHSRPVPGANDNLSGVGVLLGLARRLAERPPHGLGIILLSTGSEESFLEAMKRFGQRHFAGLDRDTTTFLCVESVGSPQLMLLDGEGMLRLHRYPRQLIVSLTQLARKAGVTLRAPFRYRLATTARCRCEPATRLRLFQHGLVSRPLQLSLALRPTAEPRLAQPGSSHPPGRRARAAAGSAMSPSTHGRRKRAGATAVLGWDRAQDGFPTPSKMRQAGEQRVGSDDLRQIVVRTLG